MANDLPDAPIEGAEFPGPYGWPKLPPGLVGLPGSKCFGSFDQSTGQSCYVTVGSVAWRRWLDIQAKKQRIIGRGARADRDPVASVLDVSVMPSESPERSMDADAIRSVTGMLDPDPMPKEYANDPVAGVVTVGEPVDNCTTCRLWNFPARLVAKLLPAGPVSAPVAVGMQWLPWVFWGGLGWWIWRKARG
jgi:hypothetical protein